MQTLRPYQKKGKKGVFDAWRNHRSVLLVAPPGAGKTTIIAHIVRDLKGKGLFLCPARELVKQGQERLEQHGVSAGIMMGAKKPKDERVHVATIQTACRRDLGKYDWIVIDECHRVRSNQYTKVLTKYPKQKILGVTATPIRLDGKSLGTVFDTLVECETTKNLTTNNYLVPLKVFLPEKPIDLSKVKVDKKTRDYSTKSLGSLYVQPALIGDAVQHYKRHGQQRPALVYCTTIAHAERVCEAFNKAGIKAEVMTGATSPTKREELLTDLQERKIRALCNVQVLTEGVDAPKVSCLVILRPTLSKALHLQILGRGARTAPNKRDCIVLDHADNCRRHGLFDADRDWDLKKGERNTGRKGKGKVPDQVKKCPKCGIALPLQAKHCPNCGLDWLPIVGPGKLTKWEVTKYK